MIQNNQFSAVTKVEKSGDSVNFIPAEGVPVQVFVCPECGYIEMYHASRFDEWN